MNGLYRMQTTSNGAGSRQQANPPEADLARQDIRHVEWPDLRFPPINLYNAPRIQAS
jgi:hypothetical protein